jgi:glycosyltransferase involved in cell wall biosynthesis
MTTSLPLVTVIIPAYNAAATLGDTLCSVRGQTYYDLEILVVDDGSQDDTSAIAEHHAQADSRVRLIRQVNAGVAAARNNALRQARGEWVAPVDADDLWHPEKIARQVEAVRTASSRVALVYNWFAQIDAAGRILHYAAPNSHEGDVFRKMFDNGLIGNGSTPLMRRDVVLACGGYDSGLHAAGAQGCEDLKLYLAIAENYHYAVAPGYLTGYRITPGNMSSNGLRMIRSQRLVLDQIARRRPDLRRDIDRAQFDFMAWYALRCIGERRIGEAVKVGLMMLGRYPLLSLREGLLSRRGALFRLCRKLTKITRNQSVSVQKPGAVGGLFPTAIAVPVSFSGTS